MKKLLLFLIPILCSTVPNLGIAKPIAIFGAGKITIILHDTDCQLKEQITNLPKRAIWLEDGKEVEGCFGVLSQFGLVSLYFSDKTATSLPAQLFEAVTGA